ncbi:MULTISPECIES: UDP-N-acetylglucosamine 2-epimerase (non-hydrolyzing) [unclassified Micromonospora]|uniref:non-hydrolyzing UDP-N-acetylglucosamine 2-epimerase n=1 Tax=unclassified Micromonospora TaxID=2617518 RepID=UPI0022B65A88|nr:MULTISPECIES: UDP-N-acetylglucosamine 2-epimerase (non-hydrolyzing) [unclassified Micromonospora]MCZ7418611.1 UDP-N-acetylglucosamine 2-epimerase (non-hydrolyzing) [Verrucosispora sp. WMMA2121]WBB92318.1 UDP-N-acetylglucosamine 2-epimerase (non-hydrolyzing) [Verrucosispora sp. WMMC514]
MGRDRARPPEVLILAGTRPEGVKIAPVARLLCHDPKLSTVVVDSGQQPGRVDEALAPFGLRADTALALRRRTGSLAELATELTSAVELLLTDRRPDAVVVHGDTTTALVSGLVAFWNRIPVVHLEAGLRSHQPQQPFPEESNRAMLARIATLHLAPTSTARRNLLAEGIPAGRIVTTGNTVVDAVRTLLREGQARVPTWIDPRRRLIVATTHRRESWGAGIAKVLQALARVAEARPEVELAVITHPNPRLAEQARTELPDLPNVRLLDPLPYPDMVGLLRASDVVVTDSGGLQEEAASLGVPLVVTRTATERPEIIEHQLGDLVGTDPDSIVEAVGRRLGQSAPVRAREIYGDGHAAQRCVRAINTLLGGQATPNVPTPNSRPAARRVMTAGSASVLTETSGY